MKSSHHRWRIAALLQLIVSVWAISPMAAGKNSGTQDLSLNAEAHAAAALLVERCGSCHGPDSTDRKATRGWADARDLASTVADPELIVPGVPDDSWLYAVIEDGEMPPNDSDVPPLDAEERALLAS